LARTVEGTGAEGITQEHRIKTLLLLLF